MPCKVKQAKIMPAKIKLVKNTLIFFKKCIYLIFRLTNSEIKSILILYSIVSFFVYFSSLSKRSIHAQPYVD